MSHCWCKCEAGLGQCGPKVPRLKSLFNAHKNYDEASLRRGDRQAELQVIWEEIGEEKARRLEELRQLVSVSVDKAYDKALEESVRRRTALQESVAHSENRLKELLGPDSMRATGPRDLSLQARLDMNMASLHELDSARVGSYGWVGGLVVMVELRRRVAVLRDTLKLPPCNGSADLDEMLLSTMESLNTLYPGKVSPVPSFKKPRGDEKPIFQRLQRFYMTLRAMEQTWVESFAQKNNHRRSQDFNSDTNGDSSDDEKSETRSIGGFDDHTERTAQLRLQELEEKRNARKRSRDVHRQKSETPPASFRTPSFRSTPMSKFSMGKNSKNKISKLSRELSDESCTLEQLSQKILMKLDELNQHVKVAVTQPGDTANPVATQQEEMANSAVLQPEKTKDPSKQPEQEMPSTVDINGEFGPPVLAGKPPLVPSPVGLILNKSPDSDQVISVLPQESDLNKQPSPDRVSSLSSPATVSSKPPSTPTSVLPANRQKSSFYVNAGIAPMFWPPAELVMERELQQKVVPPSQHAHLGLLDAFPRVFQTDAPPSDLAQGSLLFMGPGGLAPGFFAAANGIKPVDLFGAHLSTSKASGPATPSKQPVSLAVNSSQPATTTANSSHSLTTTMKSSELPIIIPGTKKLGAPPPPPPPPPPPGSGPLRSNKAVKLKRSVKIGKLYRSVKSKVEGAALGWTGDEAGPGRKVGVVTNSGEGMADALAEITKKSAYFKKIEDDVQQHAEAIGEVKLALENFQTSNMDYLLRFRNNVEIQLEDLTDESQVLARFKGFPSKKLEVVRLAAALYGRLLSMAQDLERWDVKGTASEQLEKVTRHFNKIKKEIEAVERTKEQELKLFASHKIQFNFSVLVRLKEAMVTLSSCCLVSALEASKKVKPPGAVDVAALNSYELDKLRISLQTLWQAFQLAFRVYNFAGGHDDESEKLTSELASEMETYPVEVWS